MAVEEPHPRIPAVAEWEARGRHRLLRGHEIFTLEAPPVGPETLEPLLVLHGFPTCSFDFRHVLGDLARGRRVLLLDLLGFGLSSKPDLRYSVEIQADVVQSFVGEVLEPRPRLSVLSHDMGDTVAGELLARQAEGAWPVEIVHRVVTNGSIYIEMAHLTDGQNLLLSLPDERLAQVFDPTGQAMKSALRATFAESSEVPQEELEAAWELISSNGGDRLLPRLIRYIEDRRKNQERYTGAIETHPSSLSVVWGTEDPIAVPEMATRLQARRPGSGLTLLEGVGHYPMIESPTLFAENVVQALGD